MRMLRSFFLITLCLTVLLTAAAAAAADVAKSTGTSSNFIRRSCGTTLYPELCYKSLASYASAVQRDPTRLATIAIGVSFTNVKSMNSYLAALSGQAGSNLRAAAALRDCLSMYGDAVDQIRGSINQMRSLTGKGEELRFQINNVQTWMSAAMTNEDTCTEGFVGLADGPIKVGVSRRTAGVMHVTSNALALVNNLVGH